jgi:hypothetical protein
MVAAAASLPAVRPVLAAPRCGSDQPWVLVQVRGDDWSTADRAVVLADLQRTLATQGIDACLGEAHPSTPALATLAIDVSPGSKGTVDIEVSDAVTHKRVRRDIDLIRIPPDGRAAAIAIEADELLRASWAEIALDTARARAAVPRQEVVRTVSQALTPAPSRRGSTLGARAVSEHYFGGTTLLGADAFGHWPLAPRIDLEIALGGRVSPRAAATHGRVRAVAAGAGLGLSWRLAESQRRASLDGGAALSASWLEFRADPAPGAESSPYASLMVVGRLRLVGRIAVGDRLHLTAGLEGGAALRGVEATDAGQIVASANGVELGALLGLEVP